MNVGSKKSELELKKRLDDLKKLAAFEKIIVLREFLKNIPDVSFDKSSNRAIRGHFFYRLDKSRKNEKAFFSFKTTKLGVELATIKDRKNTEVCSWSNIIFKIIERKYQIKILEPNETFYLK